MMRDGLLVPYNLSFFAENDAGEKTEQPTGRKRQKAREEGQVAKSNEIAVAALFLAIFFALRVFAPWIFERLNALFYYGFSELEHLEYSPGIDYMGNYLSYMFTQVIIISSPIFIVAMVSGVIVNLIQVKWAPTWKPLRPKFSKLNPISGFKRLFSLTVLIELVKSLAKLFIIGYTIYSMLMNEANEIFSIIHMEVLQAFIFIANLAVNLGIRIGVLYLFIAAADYAYQRYKHNKSLKMTKQEVKEEYKMTEGNPQIKGKIRQKMREASMRRMMQEIPGADVIITNPTHYAVAVKYDRDSGKAPVVVAKGVDFLAKKIREKARESDVEIVENKQLARAIYSTVDIGKEIPIDLYQAVAEILAFVYRLKNKA